MLSSSQLSVLRYHSNAGDRIAYYMALADFGDEYGRLALDVVLNNYLSGAAANTFFLDQSGGVDNDTLATISLRLMQADFARRDQLNGGDLTVDDIQTYHREVFDDVAGVSANAWTPNMYLDSFETLAARQSAWETMLTSYSPATYLAIAERRAVLTDEYLSANSQLSVTFVDLCSMDRQQMLDCGVGAGFADWFLSYSEYLIDLQSAGIGFASPNGPYQVGISQAGNMIGGNGGDNTLVGTAGDDVMNGQGGDDTFIGGVGADRYHGGSGEDTADYSFESSGIIIQLGALQGSTADEWAAINEESVVQRIRDGEGNWDFAIGVEKIVGTVHDDRVSFFGAADDYFNADDVDTLLQGGGNTDLGDVLDFSALTDVPSGLTAIWDASGTINFNTGSWAAAGAAEDFEAVIGSIGDDTITGDDQANGINGHLGADYLFGGGGDDFIFFDAADGPNVDGGADRDVAVALGSDGVTVDMTAQGLECVIGCDGADVITFGSGNGNLMAAGGAGSDTFYVSYGEGQDTRIIWASDDAESDDIIIYNSDGFGSQLGILVVTVAGLTRENFSSFDLSMLNLPTSFNWGAIDAVIINPDSRDNYYAGFDTSPMAVQFDGAISMDESLTPLEYETVADVTISQAVQGTSSALGADLHMQTEGSGWEYVEIWYREKGTTSTAWLNWGEWYDQGIEDTIEELTDEYGDPIAEWSIDMGGFQGGGDATGMSWFRDSQWTGGPNGWWFVAGGAMYGEDLVAIGAPHAIMPPTSDPSPFDWLLAA